MSVIGLSSLDSSPMVMEDRLDLKSSLLILLLIINGKRCKMKLVKSFFPIHLTMYKRAKNMTRYTSELNSRDLIFDHR